MTQQFITPIANHKGITTPRVAGDEYVTDVIVKMTVYHDADVINASDVGLSTITAATITGQSLASNDAKTGAYIAVTDVATGEYTSSSSIKLIAYDNDGDCTILADGTNFDDVTWRLRIWGQI